MPDQLLNMQRAAEKEVRVIKNIRAYGAVIARLRNAELAGLIKAMRADLSASDLSAVTGAQVTAALPRITGNRADSLAGFVRKLDADMVRIGQDLDSGSIPANSNDPIA